jgi:hypothetical protein
MTPPKQVCEGYYVVDRNGRLWFADWTLTPAITSQGYTIIQIRPDGTWTTT